MPERVKKLEGQVENVLSDLDKISVALEKLPNLEKLEKIGDNLQKITGILSQLVDAESNSGQSKSRDSGDGGKGYVA